MTTHDALKSLLATHRLVPVDTNEDMEQAGAKHVDRTNPYYGDVAANVWLAMINAAPDASALIQSVIDEVERLRIAEAGWRSNLQDAWAALRMIREAIETLGPIGSLPAEEHLEGPTFMHEAEALVAGVTKIEARATRYD